MGVLNAMEREATRTATQVSMKVDAHQHFWRYTPEEFGWIDDRMAAIRRDFLPGDLLPLLDQSGIDATVAVQACHTVAETEWLLDLAEENEWIAGVVGWVPFIDPLVHQALEKLSSQPKFKGVRHVLQIEHSEYMERADFNTGIAQLEHLGLVYDLVVLEHQLPVAIRLVDRHPRQPFVLDHIAKPRIAAREMEPWRTHIRELARRPHVVCKVSGMVTEADFDSWTPADLRPYFETALEAFGPERLLFGSDWPVCAVASSHAQWVATIEDFIGELSEDEKDRIMGENAAKIYRLSNADNSHEVD
jgi:L-fuconolactonase